ncbi:hypothetical protein HPP92_014048 [Vanilla planifolia]|uniref:Aminoacyl-tRNA synthetase class II (D/K/N) domain-containing protein n=1 Tax=Vanilla planifolia TaxID=51239 RepID=A0A835QT37_VANPL|nr:hypothetical protein HPP92_014048 [Vanilla planifolia]
MAAAVVSLSPAHSSHMRPLAAARVLLYCISTRNFNGSHYRTEPLRRCSHLLLQSAPKPIPSFPRSHFLCLRVFCCQTLSADTELGDKVCEGIQRFKKRLRIFDVKGGLDEGLGSVGKRITIRGWVRTCRVQSSVIFIEVNDGSCLSNMQCVMNSDAKGHNEVDCGNIAVGSSVVIEGTLVKSPGSKQKVELQVENLAVVTRVRNALAYATHQFFQENGFVWISSPIITASDCEGAGEQFCVTTLIPNTLEGNDSHVAKIPTTDNGSIDWSKDFFGKPAFLTVSGQLNAEAYASAFCDVYTFGPTFRAENSNTSRHLAEFWMIEPELAFADLNDDMACAAAYLQ